MALAGPGLGWGQLIIALRPEERRLLNNPVFVHGLRLAVRGGILTNRCGRKFSLTTLHNLPGAFVDYTMEGESTKSIFDSKPICRQ
jgi:hypothetical protein